MARPIPSDFDYRHEQLDPVERQIRDIYNLNVENWAKFRHAINVGVAAGNVLGTDNQDIIDSYLELGKGHYEVICSLGYAKYACDQFDGPDLFAKLKSVKDFYFHAGSLLDNLARLIYIIRVPNAATKRTKKGILRRHIVDRGLLLKDHSRDISTYTNDIDNVDIQQIVNVRNAITHYWKIPTRNWEWPVSELSTTRAYAWPYSEEAFNGYSNWTPISLILQGHLAALVQSQSSIFERLLSDIIYYERDNNIRIQ